MHVIVQVGLYYGWEKWKIAMNGEKENSTGLAGGMRVDNLWFIRKLDFFFLWCMIYIEDANLIWTPCVEQHE